MPGQLLCELHCHSTWSDGDLAIPQLVDLYGSSGFDVLAITDHVVRTDAIPTIRASNYEPYLAEIQAEAERAAALYGLLVIPGLELTFDDPDAGEAGHALALGVRRFVGLADGLDDALKEARAAGATLIAAHPYRMRDVGAATRMTARFSADPDWAAQAVDRFEVCNRFTFFDWVAEHRLPVVATGDFHRLEHLSSWKTLIPTEKSEEAVLDYLRSSKPVALTVIDPTTAQLEEVA